MILLTLSLNASRGGSRAAATSKIERFVTIFNGWKPLTIMTKCSILNVAAALDPLLNQKSIIFIIIIIMVIVKYFMF